MSFVEVLAELPALTVAERQAIIRRAMELDEAGLSATDETIVAKRLADHHKDPKSVISLDDLTGRLRSRFPK